jgi:hypothetical protein
MDATDVAVGRGLAALVARMTRTGAAGRLGPAVAAALAGLVADRSGAGVGAAIGAAGAAVEAAFPGLGRGEALARGAALLREALVADAKGIAAHRDGLEDELGYVVDMADSGAIDGHTAVMLGQDYLDAIGACDARLDRHAVFAVDEFLRRDGRAAALPDGFRRRPATIAALRRGG